MNLNPKPACPAGKRAPSSSASLLAVALSTSHCTLTADTFTPSPVGNANADPVQLDGPVGAEPPVSVPPGRTSSAPSASGSTEEGPSPVGLDPERLEGGLGDDASSSIDATRDAGTESADARAPAPAEPTEPSEPTDPEPTDPSPVDSCPSSELGGSCYEFFAERLSWEAAESSCVAWGGHLASVESSEEDAFLDGWPAILGVPQGDGSGIWLGGTDAQQDGDFRWPGDRPLTFSGWAPNQPDNGAGVDCIEKRNDGAHRWYDLRCTDAEPYVCERPL